MNILTFDTETTSLDKPFCYNVGYTIANTDTNEVMLRRDFVVEQVWHNLELFCSAYYCDKRPIYVSRMKARKTIMDKWGYIMRQMASDIKTYNVAHAYAYNSDFDNRVFNFCCEWFKTLNPFDNVAIHDIRGYACEFIVNDKYKQFCEQNKYFTDSGNYSTTAETMFRYLANSVDFNEEHTALADSEIEQVILLYCLSQGADITLDYPCPKSIQRLIKKTLTVKTQDKEYNFDYYTKTTRKDTIYLK